VAVTQRNGANNISKEKTQIGLAGSRVNPAAEHPAQQPAHAEETEMPRETVLRVAGLLQRLVRQVFYGEDIVTRA